MASEQASRVFALASRDLVVAIAARENFASHLEAFARRRGALYARPAEGAAPTPGPTEESYWPTIAATLAAIAPMESVPMSGLIELGVTLEGGARGLRGLFTSTPSDKERKRVQRIAALTARVMEIVAGADDALSSDERRAIGMAMASFGLTAEELTDARPTARLTPAELVLFGEVDARVRKELVRGAWQLALRGTLHPAEEEAVRAVAARLDASPECEAVRLECVAQNETLSRMAKLAVELARGIAKELPEANTTAALEHLVQAAAPTAVADELRARIKDRGPTDYAATLSLDRARRVQAVALAWATLVGTDPTYSMALHLRGELAAAASEAGAGYEVAEALDEVDRFLHQRVRDAALRGGARS